MVNVGDRAKLVTAQSVRLLQGTDDYHQLFNANFEVTRPSTKKARTDAVVERMEGLAEHFIEGDILITVPEITTLIGMSLLVNRQLPQNAWDLQFTSRDGTTDTIRITAKLTGLTFVRPAKGLSMFHIRLDISGGDVTEP